MAKKISQEQLRKIQKSGAKVSRKPKAPVVTELDNNKKMLADLAGTLIAENKKLLESAVKSFASIKQEVQVSSVAPPPMKRVIVENVQRNSDGDIAGFDMNIEREKTGVH